MVSKPLGLPKGSGLSLLTAYLPQGLPNRFHNMPDAVNQDLLPSSPRGAVGSEVCLFRRLAEF